MESEKRRSAGDSCWMVVDGIQTLATAPANGGRHTYTRRRKIGFTVVSIVLLLFLAALFSRAVWKGSPSETGIVVEDPGEALERHIILNPNNPEDKGSWYMLNLHGRVTSVTVKGKTVNKGMTLMQVTDLLGEPSHLTESDPRRNRCRIATYAIQSNYFHFYFDSAKMPLVDFIVIDGGY